MTLPPEPEWGPEEVEAARLLAEILEEIGEPDPRVLEAIQRRLAEGEDP